MMRNLLFCLLPACMLVSIHSFSQSADTSEENTVDLPSKIFNRIKKRTTALDQQISCQTEKYLNKMMRRETRLKQKLATLDSASSRTLFAGSAEQYANLIQKMRTDTGTRGQPISGEYQPYADSLSGMLRYLQQTSAGQAIPGVDEAASKFQSLQAKMRDADEVKEYIRQRKQQISDYIGQHAGMASVLGKQYQGMSQDLYYYSQSVRQYKQMLNDPDKLEQQALSLLNKTPVFRAFMKQNSQLAGLFGLPSNYASPESLAGLQTRDQVSALIQGRVATGGEGGAATLTANLQGAQSQLDEYKDKLSKLGNGSGDIDMPNFKPNEQKTKTFWQRLEYGANFQTTRNNYYFPTTSDFGVSIGYTINNTSTIGIGASYKLGWGSDFNHIKFSSQGIGIRSFMDVKIKGSFFASGGFEYNYATPFHSAQQLQRWNDWTRSGLIGISKTVSMKSRLFKKTKLGLLWDFLSYQQRPKTQPIIFRIGYMWH